MNVLGKLRQTVTVYPAGAPSSGGAPSMGAPVSLPARIQPTTKVVMGPNGTPSQASHIIYTATAIGPYDQVVVPGSTVKRKPLQVNTEVDGAGRTQFYKTTI